MKKNKNGRTLISQIIKFREGFGPGRAIFSEFPLQSDFGGAGGRFWSIWTSLEQNLHAEMKFLLVRGPLLTFEWDPEGFGELQGQFLGICVKFEHLGYR